ncbi:hypothetical protein [Priestia koreensis]
MMTEAYRMLYEIEVGLREHAEEIMNRHHGPLSSAQSVIFPN